MARSFLPLGLLLTGSLLILSPARAAKVKVWHHHTPGAHDKARLQHAVVSSEGTLRLARRLKPLAGLDATHVWDLAEDGEGNLFVATGDEGRIYKVTPDGKVSLVHTAEQSQVLCLAVAADNTVYAGTGPSGQILRLGPRGARVLCETGESYVWSLALDPKTQTLYAGTGPHGRIYRVTPEGKATLFYATRQDHVLCVAAGPGGSVYAGTDKGGLVYRIDRRGKAFVLFQAPQSEVRALKVTPDGLYVGTSAPGSRRSGVSRASQESRATAALDRDEPEAVAHKPAVDRKKVQIATAKAKKGESRDSEKSSAAPAPSEPAGGENSVYRITADGSVREVFREKALVLSLLRQGDHFFVGTGMEGKLFEADEATRERTEIARLDHGQVLSLCRRRDSSIVVGTGDPGKLYVLEDRSCAKGTATSDVLDAKLVSKWGSLRWQADTPKGTAVTVAVRSGNVAEPDDTWSDWSEEQTDGQRATVTAPAARFVQYRVTLTSEDPTATPAVHAVTLRYVTTNQAPEVTKVEAPDLNAVNLENPKKLKFKWSATDANEDDLTYRVYVRKEGWSNWVELEDDWEKTDYEWDTTTTPSGVYRLKVVASDRKDNPEKDALTGQRVSAPFVVSHAPPAVTVKTAGAEEDEVILEATARSPLVRLTAASFAVNGKKWINVFPTDGLFDSKAETFRFRAEALKPGTYVLVLRVRDAAGNTGSGDVVFTVPARAVSK